eukprot:1129353-Pelagomonas_calceolata.AAC.1
MQKTMTANITMAAATRARSPQFVAACQGRAGLGGEHWAVAAAACGPSRSNRRRCCRCCCGHAAVVCGRGAVAVSELGG